MSYPRNAATPPRVAVGPVVQISDGAVQTSGVSIRVVPQGGSAAAGLGTTSYEDGIVLYAPTQAETNYEAFAIIAYKTGCIPATTTVVTSDTATAGRVRLSGETHSGATIPTVTTVTNRVSANTDQWGGVVVTGMPMPTYTQPTGFLAATFPTTVASTTNITTVGAVSGSVGSVTGNVGGSVGSISGVTFPANFGVLLINASGHISRVTLVDTTTTNTDMRGTDGAALASVWTSTVAGRIDATIGSRSSHSAADVWAVATRTLTAFGFSVTVDTNNDKTGYSLTQAFPSNFASLVISAGGVADANVTQWNGGSLPTIGTSTLTAADVWTYAVSRTLTTTIPTAAAIADAVWDEAYAGHTSSGTFGKLMDILRKSNYVTEGTVAAGQTPTTTVFRSGLTAPTGTYDHQTILFLSGTLTGESRPIDTYSQTNGTFTLAEPLTSAPAIGDEFVLLPDHVHPITAIAAGVRTELAAELALVDVAISTRLATSGYTAPDNAGIAAVKAKTDNLPAAPAAVSDIPTAVAIATEVDNTLTANHGAGSWAVGGTGSGAYTFTVTVNDGATALQNATVRLAEGVNAFTGQTNASGVVAFSLDAATYSVAITKDGYSFTPTTKVVGATGSQTYSMTQITPTIPAAAGLSTGTAVCYGTTGLPIAGVVVTIQQVQGKGTDGSAYDGDTFTLTSNANGVISHNGFVRGAVYSIRRGIRGEAKSFTVPDAASFDLSEVVGRD